MNITYGAMFRSRTLSMYKNYIKIIRRLRIEIYLKSYFPCANLKFIVNLCMCIHLYRSLYRFSDVHGWGIWISYQNIWISEIIKIIIY